MGPARCIVADFKMLTITENNPTRREEAARAWLQRNGPRCSEAQIRVLISNAPAWLGTSHSPVLVATLDGLLERHIADDPAKLVDHYSPGGRSAGAAGASGAGGGAAGAGARAPAAPPAAAVTAGMAPPTAAVAAPVLVPAVVAGVAAGGAAPSTNMNVTVQVGTPTDNKTNAEDPRTKRDPNRSFSPAQRTAVRAFFEQQRDPKLECPPFTAKDRSGTTCVSVRGRAKAWKVDEPLDKVLGIKDIPMGLRERLGAPGPGFRYVQVMEDILLVEESTNKVVDVVLDLGGVPVKPVPAGTAPAAASAASAPSASSTPATPPSPGR